MSLRLLLDSEDKRTRLLRNVGHRIRAQKTWICSSMSVYLGLSIGMTSQCQRSVSSGCQHQLIEDRIQWPAGCVVCWILLNRLSDLQPRNTWILSKCRIFVEKPDGKKLLVWPWSIMEDNINIDLEQEGREWVDWINLSENRYKRRSVVITVMNHRAHKMREICWLGSVMCSNEVEERTGV